MTQTWTPEVRPDAREIIATANEIVFAVEVEEWLRTRARTCR